MKKLGVFLVYSLCLISCSTIIPIFTKKKLANQSFSSLATSADHYFWKHFHEGNYDSIPEILHLLKAAYIENPNNATLAAHIGFTHAWALSERIRLPKPSANVIDHATLANKYFKEAMQLDPSDIRLKGFHGDFLMSEGSIDQDQKKIVKGYLETKKVARQWPEWGDFTLSYPLSLSNKTDKRFQESIDLMWHNADACACEKVDREHLDWKKYYPLLNTDLTEKNRRACWNTWIAPHNLEGFFIHFGDILIKSGDLKKGLMMYQNAKSVPEYESYPYKEVVELRIKNAQENLQRFNQAIEISNGNSNNVLMINSKISCMGCHQKTKYIAPDTSRSYVAPHLKR